MKHDLVQAIVSTIFRKIAESLKRYFKKGISDSRFDLTVIKMIPDGCKVNANGQDET